MNKIFRLLYFLPNFLLAMQPSFLYKGPICTKLPYSSFLTTTNHTIDVHMITLKPKYHRKLKTYADLGVYILLLILSLVLLGTVTSCQKNELALPNACGTMATIKDLRGLDGCGFVLELDNGERLEPVYNYGFCGTPPLPAPTIDKVDFIDGKRVSIAFNVLPDRGSICMAGKVVEITCISESRDASE